MLRIFKFQFKSYFINRFAPVKDFLFGHLNQLRLDVLLSRLARFFFTKSPK